MTSDGTISRELTAAAFLAIRMALGFAMVIVMAVCVRRAILTFAGKGYRHLGRRRWWLAGANILAIVVLELAKAPVEAILTTVAGAIGPVGVIPDPQWLGVVLIGLCYTGVATLTLVLAIQLVGALYWGVEARRDAWRARIGPARAAGAARDVRAELLDAVGWLNRAVRAVLLSGLLLSFLTVTLRFFPRTAPVVDAVRLYLANPARTIGLAIAQYLPNLGYLTVIGFLGWIALRLLRHTFDALGNGTLVIRGFLREWAEPTYKLSRMLLLLFLLMVTFRTCPGPGRSSSRGSRCSWAPC